ncbi:MAG: response regulator [Hydrogeniiclostridium mannosilyticum]
MSMNPLIESLVVEDEALMRRTVIKRLEASPVGFQVVGEAKNGREALKLIRLLQPKVVFSDVYMPVMDGLELARILQMEFPEIRVVIISGHRDFEYAQKAIRYGVVNYLIKPLEPKALDEVLTSLREGILREQSNLVRRDIEEMLSGGAGRGAGRRFGFFLASLGYSLSAPTVEASMRLKGLWSQVLGQLPEDPDWYVFNGSRTGEMYFLCELSGVNTETRMERLAKQLFESLLSLSDGHPVNLCAPHGGVTEENLFPVRQQCSRLLLEQQRIGPGAIFWLQESSEKPAATIHC